MYISTFKKLKRDKMVINEVCFWLQYSEKDLYTQLSFFQYIFDLSKALHTGEKIDAAICNAYSVLHEHVSQVLSQSAYSVINLTKLFNGLFPTSFQIKEEPKDT